MSAEQVWKANREKVSFVKEFPGRLQGWGELAGKRIEKVIALPNRSTEILVCEDRTFVVVPKLDPEPADLLAGLLAARPELEPVNSESYRELDRLVNREKELLRRARLEKILGAVTNNMKAIPELKEELLNLLSKL